jgi:hypothetical protein
MARISFVDDLSKSTLPTTEPIEEITPTVAETKTVTAKKPVSKTKRRVKA